MLWLAAASLLLSLALLTLGLRGRLTDNHPLCRKCRFDLIGLSLSICPECGADLSTPKSTLPGHRRRRRTPLAAGILLLTASLILGGLETWSRSKGFNWNTIKPYWLLHMQARAADDPGAISELASRIDRHELSRSRLDSVITTALNHQADNSRPLAPEWHTLIVAADFDHVLTNEQITRYVRQGMTLSLRARSHLPAGSTLLMLLNEKATRMHGLCDSIGISSVPISIKVGDTDVPPDPRGEFPNEVTIRTNTVNYYRAKLTAPPSASTLSTTWRITVSRMPDRPAIYNGPAKSVDPKNIIGTFNWSSSLPFTVLPADAPLFRIIRDPALADKIAASIGVGSITATPGDRGASISGSFTITDAPCTYLFSVKLRAGGREWDCHNTLQTWDPSLSPLYATDLAGFDADKADLILEPQSPDPAANAAMNTLAEDFWGDTVILRDIPIAWPSGKPTAANIGDFNNPRRR